MSSKPFCFLDTYKNTQSSFHSNRFKYLQGVNGGYTEERKILREQNPPNAPICLSISSHKGKGTIELSLYIHRGTSSGRIIEKITALKSSTKGL
tara:strand:- start:1118 stop:1399 length:282 start_codon:yes stop_codon:yes gene_type:complete